MSSPAPVTRPPISFWKSPSALHDNPMGQQRLTMLRTLGVRIALDDFGARMPSLPHLARLPIDIVKIDQSFVAGLGIQTDDDAVVRAVIDLSAALGMTTIAEGVETSIQEGLLRDLGCNQAQGYLYGRPQPAST